MTVKTALRSARNGQRRVVRLQRRLWLAELALWPAVLLSAVLLSAGAWVLWQRRSGVREAAGTTPPPVDVAPPTVAGPDS